jgi:mannose-6-phosphate isomerase
LFVGLKRGVTRDAFEKKIQDGSVAECFHRVPVHAGDAMFLPSGRVHAIGAGLVIFEIQQNSDTTYRVSDWNRVGLDGKPRELHVPQSLASIDFNDFEPSLIQSDFKGVDQMKRRTLVHDALFDVVETKLSIGTTLNTRLNQLQIITVLEGNVLISDSRTQIDLSPGGFCMISACLPQYSLLAESNATLLQVKAV